MLLLVHIGIKIKLVHIPAQSGLEGNVKADKLAKDTAFKIASGKLQLQLIYLLNQPSAFAQK